MQDAIKSGVLAGFPVVDIKFTLFDGSYHDVDSNENACGEGSALTASIEGNRGMPRVKPPRTVEKGLF